MFQLFVVLGLAYWVGLLFNFSLFIVLIVQEFILYQAGAYKYEQKLGYKEVLKRIWRAFLIIISSWGFWFTQRHTINDFYIMDRR